jgi:hypothetical protein
MSRPRTALAAGLALAAAALARGNRIVGAVNTVTLRRG